MVVQLCAVRCAISRPTVPSSSTFVAAAWSAVPAAELPADVVAAAPEPLAACMTSSARISPPGPEPRRRVTSTPCSRARRRALGEMRTSEEAVAPGALAAAVAAVAAEGALSLRPGLRRRRGYGCGFARGEQPGNRLADRDDGAFMGRDCGENAVAGRFDFDDGFIGFDFQQWLAFGHLLAFPFAPGDDFACLLGHLQRGHYDADGHMRDSSI